MSSKYQITHTPKVQKSVFCVQTLVTLSTQNQILFEVLVSSYIHTSYSVTLDRFLKTCQHNASSDVYEWVDSLIGGELGLGPWHTQRVSLASVYLLRADPTFITKLKQQKSKYWGSR